MARATMINVPFEGRDRVRIGLVGAGNRGSSLLGNLLAIDGAQVVAVADASSGRAGEAADRIAAAGWPRAAAGTDATALIERDDVDLVIIASPWELHTPLAVAAMRAGKHAAVEVPAALTLDDCWALVDASEQTRRHCVMLENCNYGYNELLVLNLVRDGVLGELLHAEAAYLHDLRRPLMTDKAWRRKAHVDYDANLYPTHGLGPVAAYLDVNRGDRFVRMTSMSSASRGLDAWRNDHPDELDPSTAGEVYRCGDINTSIVATQRGRTILLQHQVVGPRPYSRRNEIVGTKGIFTDFPPRIFVEDPDDPEQPEEYAELDAFRQYEHALWTEEGARARESGGHGGMDYLMLLRLITAMRSGAVPEMDVYDAAAWSAPAPLSVASVAAGGAPVDFPDFTCGRWAESRPGIR
ncbi:Gfo/Idh/MocA family protein [Microlunatus speluncae]|uniref:Gfo/Idh/MocA family protein n=1 Tax=Microlunatus speluncae TaxID=2594267 RepID=UPI00126643D5|nr:Gfo/Idh/MocA family oxidoreductase [Microlunatus speluncae]